MAETQPDELRQQLLKTNQSLQESIRNELRTLAQHKAQNRSWALYYTKHIAVVPREVSNTPTRRGRKNKKTTNHYCKVNERFFIDGRGSQPEPNADAVRRRQQLEASTFFHHTQPPWSSAQDQALQQIVNQHKGRGTLDWNEFADALHEQLPNVPRRSPDECSIQYKRHDSSGADSAWKHLVAQNQKKSQTSPWTLPQDNLLLKYIAAAGPQQVWGTDAIVRLTTKMFPHKTRLQLFNRIHQSLLNPNFVHDAWTLQEERKLVLLMKFYQEPKSQNVATAVEDSTSSMSENDSTANTNDEENDSHSKSQHRPRQHNSSLTLYRAASHFPRNTKSVADKWHRTLNPEQYTTRPFTPSEHEELVRVVREHPTIGWTQLSQEHFPHRHPHRLMLRWYEQSTVESFAQRQELLQEQEQSRSRKRAAAMTNATDTSQPKRCASTR